MNFVKIYILACPASQGSGSWTTEIGRHSIFSAELYRPRTTLHLGRSLGKESNLAMARDVLLRKLPHDVLRQGFVCGTSPFFLLPFPFSSSACFMLLG